MNENDFLKKIIKIKNNSKEDFNKILEMIKKMKQIS